MFERQARAKRDAVQRLLGHVARYTGMEGHKPVQLTEQGATTGEHNPFVNNVGR